MGEVELTKLFLARVHASLPWLRLFRRQAGKFRMLWGPGVMHVGIPGQADCHGFDDTGHCWEVELKAVGGKRSPEQERWAELCARYRVRYMLLEERRGETSEQTVTRWVDELSQYRAS